jgi:hypothetical protein
LELLDRVAFDPGVVRGDQGDAVEQMQDAIAHEDSISGSEKRLMWQAEGPGQCEDAVSYSARDSINPGKGLQRGKRGDA